MFVFMNFLIERLDVYNNTPPEQRNYREKFAALSALSCLSDELKGKPVRKWICI